MCGGRSKGSSKGSKSSKSSKTKKKTDKAAPLLAEEALALTSAAPVNLGRQDTDMTDAFGHVLRR